MKCPVAFGCCTRITWVGIGLCGHATRASPQAPELVWGRRAVPASAEVNGPDIKAQNDFGAPAVRPASRSGRADGRSLGCTLAPHSYTLLKAKLAGSPAKRRVLVFWGVQPGKLVNCLRRQENENV